MVPCFILLCPLGWRSSIDSPCEYLPPLVCGAGAIALCSNFDFCGYRVIPHPHQAGGRRASLLPVLPPTLPPGQLCSGQGILYIYARAAAVPGRARNAFKNYRRSQQPARPSIVLSNCPAHLPYAARARRPRPRRAHSLASAAATASAAICVMRAKSRALSTSCGTIQEPPTQSTHLSRKEGT